MTFDLVQCEIWSRLSERMRGVEDLIRWPLLVYEGIEFVGETTIDRLVHTKKEWERDTACV